MESVLVYATWCWVNRLFRGVLLVRESDILRGARSLRLSANALKLFEILPSGCQCPSQSGGDLIVFKKSIARIRSAALHSHLERIGRATRPVITLSPPIGLDDGGRWTYAKAPEAQCHRAILKDVSAVPPGNDGLSGVPTRESVQR